MKQYNQQGWRESEALACVMMVVQSLNLPASLAELENCGLKDSMTARELIKGACRKFQVKGTWRQSNAEEFLTVVSPFVTEMQDGSFRVIGMKDSHKVVVFPPGEKPVVYSFQDFIAQWSGGVLQLTPAWTWRNILIRYNITWFSNVLVHYKRILSEVVAASFFLQLFGLLTPLFTQVLVDKVLVNRGVSTLDILTGGLVVLYLLQGGMGFLRTYLLTHTTNKFDAILGTRMFRHLLALPLPYFENRRVGDTMMRIGALTTVREFLTGTALTLALDTFFAIVFIGIMFTYDVKLTLVVLGLLPVFLFINYHSTPVFQQRLNAVWETGAENNAFLIEAVSGMHTIKSLALEPQFNHRWEQLLGKYVSRTFDSAAFGIGIGSVSQVLQMVSGFAVLWLGGNMVMNGQMTLGQLIAFQMLSAQAVTPIMHLVGSWQTFQQAGLSMERLGDIINTRPEPVLQPSTQGRQALQGELLFEDITFRYRPDHEPVLRNISFQVPAGSRVGIVGRSGSGKSTLTKLVQRLYLPEAGTIRIDGIALQEVEPQWLRPQIGVVMQENYLFNGTVRENIALSRPSATMGEVIQSAITAGAHEFILELSEGYDTNVGEKGASLSGGQRQRIAIARALLSDPKVLIFDEATSALDYESEVIIMENLDKICAGRTMLMIAHRLSTVRDCDIIVVIDHGQLAEQGSHQELMAAKGLYYNLYQQQEG